MIKEGNMDSVEFTSKTHVVNEVIKIRKYTFIFIMIYLCMLIILMSIGKIKSQEIFLSFIIILGLLLTVKKREIEVNYVPVSVKFSIDNSKIIYRKYEVPRLKTGVVTEEIIWQFSRINKLEYSLELKAFNLEGYPIINSYDIKNGKMETKDSNKNGKPIKTVIYVDEKEKKEIEKMIKSNLDIEIQYLE